MKKTAIIFSLLFMTFAIFSCDNAKEDEKDTENTEEKSNTPEAMAEEMIEKLESYTDFLIEMADDGVISDDEVTKLKDLTADIEAFEEEFDKLYAEDEEAEAIVDGIREENAQLEEDLFAAMMALYECEGVEKLDDM